MTSCRRIALLVLPMGVLSVLSMGCRGKLLATAELRAPGSATTRFNASTTKLVLWADTDAEWKGSKSSKPEVSYEIDVRQGGKLLGHVTCSTTDRAGMTVCGSTSNIFGKHSGDCEIALACRLPTFAPGELELAVSARTGANVLKMNKMSLNVRVD